MFYLRDSMDKTEKPNFYAIIPANVRYASDLSELQKLLYGEITALADKHGYCFASNGYFARLYKKTSKRISSTLRDMNTKGYLRLETKKEEWRYRKIYIWELKKLKKEIIATIPEKKEGIPLKKDTPIPEKKDTLSQKNGNIVIQDNNTSERIEEEEKTPPPAYKNIEFINWMRDVETRWSFRLKKWNDWTGRKDIMNNEIKKEMYSVMKNNTTWEDFDQRISKYVEVISLIEDKKLKNYIYYPIREYDFLQFLSKINQFYGEVSLILSKIAIKEYKTKIVGMLKPTGQQVEETKDKKIYTPEETQQIQKEFREKFWKVKKQSSL